MAEGEAAVRGTSDGGEGTGARIVGGSLPPRKRLLAGLKQNGLWGGASGPGSATAETPVHRQDGGGEGTTAASALLRNSPSDGVGGGGAAAAVGDGKGGCVGCGALESDVWRKAKRSGGGGVVRVCEVCNLSSQSKSLNCCPLCQGVCPEVKDPAVWIECCRCQRFVHLECDQRSPPLPGEGPYVCLDCLHFKKDEEHVDAVQSTGAVAGSLLLKSDAEAETCALPAGAERPIPSNKKPRVSRESRSKSNDVEPDDVGSFEEIRSGAKVLLGGKGGASSKQAAATAAAAAAALAGRAAAAAKASASAKAAAAVRAAAMAKAALDAAALAARVEFQGRVELRRSSVSSGRADAQLDAVLSQLKRERPDETEVKSEGVEVPAITNLSSIDDEEMARQLHRAINSSPRISSGLTPQRRKPLTKPAATVSTSHAVTSWPRLGLSSESEHRLQNKHQQTRPRSLQLKEAKRIDCRDVKLESKPSGGNGRTKVPQQQNCAVASGSVTELLALKSEPADSSTITLVRQDSANMLLHDETSVPLNVPARTDNSDRMNGATAVLCDLDDSQDRVRTGADNNVSQAAALLDEVLMSEVDEDEASKEEYLSRLQDRADVHLKEDPPASTTKIIEEAVLRTNPQEEARESTEDVDMANASMSGVAALVQVATSAIELLENQDTSSSAAVVDGACSTVGDDDSLADVSAAENSDDLTVKSSIAISAEPSKASSDSENPSACKSLPQPPVSG